MQTPSERIVAAANAVVTVTDAEGKRITLRRPGALDRLRLFRALGPYLAGNELYLGMAMLAIAVTEIDGVPILPPQSEGQLEDIIARLGNAGTHAVGEVLNAPPEGGVEGAAGN